jgi:hypothetical protein
MIHQSSEPAGVLPPGEQGVGMPTWAHFCPEVRPFCIGQDHQRHSVNGLLIFRRQSGGFQLRKTSDRAGVLFAFSLWCSGRPGQHQTSAPGKKCACSEANSCAPGGRHCPRAKPQPARMVYWEKVYRSLSPSMAAAFGASFMPHGINSAQSGSPKPSTPAPRCSGAQ